MSHVIMDLETGQTMCKGKFTRHLAWCYYGRRSAERALARFKKKYVDWNWNTVDVVSEEEADKIQKSLGF